MAWSPIKEKKADTKGAAGKIAELHQQMGQPSGNDVQGSKDDSAQRQANLHTGMELLEMDFLLGVVENTDGSDENDVQMRRLVFNELLRRDNGLSGFSSRQNSGSAEKLPFTPFWPAMQPFQSPPAFPNRSQQVRLMLALLLQ